MRSKKAILNTFSGWFGQLLIVIVNLISRKYFLVILGENYLGLNGLFSNIISFLSMAELGVGTAITYSLYKPIAENDIDAIKSIMGFFKKVYCSIGFLIFICGMALMPFLSHFVRGLTFNDSLYYIYLLFLVDTSITYFFSYKSALILADQKGFVFNINHYLWRLLMYVFQILALHFTRNYYIYLCVQVFSTIMEYYSISKIANKMYPFLLDKNVSDIDEKTKKSIFSNTYSMVLNKIGGTIVNSTDNILISALISVANVAKYNNYTNLISSASGFLLKGLTATGSSVANFSVNESAERKRDIFNVYYLMSVWLYGWLSIGLYYLLPLFIALFYGEQYLLSESTMKIICMNTYLDGQIVLFSIFIAAMGLYWHVRFLGIIEAFLNLFISLIAGKILGIMGIVLGTLLSRLFANLVVDSNVVFKFGLDSNNRRYFLNYIRDSLVVFTCFLIIHLVRGYLVADQKLLFIELLVLCIFIPNIVFYIAWGKSKAFCYIRDVFIKILK